MCPPFNAGVREDVVDQRGDGAALRESVDVHGHGGPRHFI
jgi:hypothetical protein